MSENICVSIDMATPVVVTIEAYVKENKCVLPGEIISRTLELYRKFREFVAIE